MQIYLTTQAFCDLVLLACCSIYSSKASRVISLSDIILINSRAFENTSALNISLIGSSLRFLLVCVKFLEHKAASTEIRGEVMRTLVSFSVRFTFNFSFGVPEYYTLLEEIDTLNCLYRELWLLVSKYANLKGPCTLLNHAHVSLGLFNEKEEKKFIINANLD